MPTKHLHAIQVILFLFATAAPQLVLAGNSPTFEFAADDRRAQITASDAQALSMSFELVDLQHENLVKEGVTYEYFALPGEGLTYDPGKPILPAVSRFVIVPPDAGLELVVEADNPTTIRAEHPPVICTDEEVTWSRFANLPENSLYPPMIAEMSDPIVVRGVRMVKVTTYPIQYDARSNSYLHRPHIRTDIRYTDAEPINPAVHAEHRRYSEHFLNYLERLAVNGNQVRRDQSVDANPPYVGHYCVVSHESCLPYVRPFIEWRRKAGYKVDIINETSNNAGNSNRIQDDIENLYDSYVDDHLEPFEYLLLVGDRSQYNGQPQPNWVLEAPVGNTIWQGYAPHADYIYGTLEGNDSHPDVAIGRWWSGGREIIQLAVGRTLMYEATPWMENTDWFTRGGVYSQHWGNDENGAWHITIHTNVRWGYEVLEHLGFNEVRFYEEYDYDVGGDWIGPELVDWFNEGANVLIGRAEVYYWNGNFQGVRRNTVFPVNICLSGHGEWACETMTRSGSGNNLMGPVNMTCGWGWPATLACNAIWLEMVNGCLLRDLPMGWAYCMGITAFELYLDNYRQMEQPIYTHMKTDVNHFGDPGLQPWIGVPRLVEAEFPESINPATKSIEVHVVAAEDDDIDIAGAQVTFYAPGTLPEDNNDYAVYDDMYMQTLVSDTNGNVHFVLEDAGLDDSTTAYITVTGRDIRPYFGEVSIERPRGAVELTDFQLTETDGNDDGEINPGERFSLGLTAMNVGTESDYQDVTAQVISLSPWIEVEARTISFSDIDHESEAEGDTAVSLTISSACPDGVSRPITRPTLLIRFRSDEITWESAIKLTPQAPNYEVKRVSPGNRINVGANNLDIEIENTGSLDGSPLIARLLTLDMGASVVTDSSRYAAINSGGSARLEGNDFVVAGNQIVVPGFMNEMLLVLSAEDGFVDSAWFQLQIREPIDNGPIGPDPYGYICFDDTDEDWDIAPIYEWAEISTNEDWEFRGTEMDFEGSSDQDIGEALVVELGFTTVFYGYEYDRITVGTNGFIAMGDQTGDGEHPITNFQNWPMDRAMGGGVGMIAPLWDDLRLRNEDAAIYFYHDEEDARFIVEWYKLSHASGGDRLLTFEVILYDRETWITESGNQNILIQYQSIQNVRGQVTNDPEGNVPQQNTFASVGISGPDGYGLSYSFNNQYPTGAASLENRRALLFTTSPEYKSGTLFGRVTDVATGEPIMDASVCTEHGFTANTDENGDWRIEDALAEVPFNITALKLGYNDSTYYELEVEEDGELEINFALLHPEFIPSTRFIYQPMDPDTSIELGFTLRNTGNGPLYWSMQRRLPRGADAPPWSRRVSYAIGDSTGDSRIEGVIFIDSLFYVAGANMIGRENGPDLIYMINRDGVLVDTMLQPEGIGSNYGMRDLAWDGELIWGTGSNMIGGFNLQGELVDSFAGPYNPNHALAWDPDREVLWVSAITDGISAIDRDGDVVTSVDRSGFRIYGLAYWVEDPDDHPLYIFHNPQGGAQLVHKMNPDNGDTMFVANLGALVTGAAAGACITNQYDVYSWVFVDIANDGPSDRIDIWQLDARRDWFRVFTENDTGQVEAVADTIQTQETQQFTLLLNSQDLPRVEFGGYLVFDHNAAGGVDTLNVLLDVIGPVRPTPFDLLYPENGHLLNANVDTIAVPFSWEASRDYNFNDIPRYEAWFKLDDDSLMIRSDLTNLVMNLYDLADSLDRSIEEEFRLEWWVMVISGEDSLECVQRFYLNFVPNALGDHDGVTPVEFGLQSVYPSPFNARTTIGYGIDRPSLTTLRVYDLLGRQVAVLLNREQKTGNYRVIWNAASLPSGLYILRLESLGRIDVRKVTLIR